MSQIPPPSPPLSSGELQFNTAEPVRGPDTVMLPAASCVGCGQPITDTYFAGGDKIVCPACRDRFVATMAGGSGIKRFATATAFGVGAGLLGAAIWYAVVKATGYTLGLIAIVVGYMVGTAVLKGSGGRGGRGYQILAVLLTYCAVCITFVPEIFGAIREGASTGARQTASATQSTRPANSADAPGPLKNIARPMRLLIGAILVFAFSLAMPFLGGTGPIGILILGFALWEAWKINRRRVADLAGPYRLMNTSQSTPGIV